MSFNKSSIFDDIYIVTVPIMATYIDSELDAIGSLVETNDRGRRIDAYNEPTTVGLSIYGMALVHSKGMYVRLVDNRNLEFIYHTLESFFTHIDSPLSSSPNKVTRFTDDVITVLDNFAQEIFKNNGKELNYRINKLVKESSFGDFGSLNLISNDVTGADKIVLERSRRNRKPIKMTDIMS